MCAQVPLACDLGRVVPQLADRQLYDGVVDLPLRKAQAMDPGDVALQHSPEGDAARQARPSLPPYLLSWPARYHYQGHPASQSNQLDTK